MRDQIAEKQFASIPLHGMSTEMLRKASGIFRTFLEEVPNEEKRLVHFKSPYHRGTATGYIDMRDIPGKDPKEYFHWNPGIKSYAEYMTLEQSSEAARKFFAVAEQIYNKAAEMAYLFLEEHYERFLETCFDNGRLTNGHLRFLCYTPCNEEFSAKAHYDKGIGTLALAESSSGLRIGCCAAHDPNPVEHQEDHALFMPGDLMWHIPREDWGEPGVIPAYHDVVQDSSIESVSNRCARWAIVFFINHKNGRYSEWNDVHKPLPVHEPFEVAA